MHDAICERVALLHDSNGQAWHSLCRRYWQLGLASIVIGCASGQGLPAESPLGSDSVRSPRCYVVADFRAWNHR